MTGMKFGPDTADWLLGLPRLAVQATRLLRSALRSRAQTGSRALSIWMMDKESCTGDLPVPNLPQVHDGNTVGDDAALGLLAIASFIIRYRDEGATPGEYETAASAHVGDSRKRLVVTLANASRLERSRPCGGRFA